MKFSENSFLHLIIYVSKKISMIQKPWPDVFIHLFIEQGDLVGNKEKTEGFVNKYYDIATSFYEHGWGPCFHFATQTRDETFREAIRRHEYYLAMKLSLKKDMKVLDVGCGIGGPAVNIARFRYAINKFKKFKCHKVKRPKGQNYRTQNALKTPVNV